MQYITHNVTEDSEDYTMDNLSGVSVKPLKVTVRVGNADIDMEIDTGASVSTITCGQMDSNLPYRNQL